MLRELSILLGCTYLCVAEAPAFLWDPQSSEGPKVLESMSTVKFSEAINSRLAENRKLVIFLMDKLSIEDLHMHAESFPHVKSEMSRGWSLSVGRVEGIVPHLKQLSTAELVPLSHDDLVKSDEVIAEVMHKEENKNAIGIFTAEGPSFKVSDSYMHVSGRRLLAADPERNSSSSFYNVTVNGTDIFLLFNKINLVVTKDENKVLDTPVVVNLSADALSVSALQTEYGFRMSWSKMGTVDSVVVNVKFSQLKPKRQWVVERMWMDAKWNTSSVVNQTLSAAWLSAPLSRSYHCSLLSTATAVGSAVGNTSEASAAELQFVEIQVEPYKNKYRWSPADDCVGFYTIGVWMGLLPILLFTVLLLWGLYMIADIKINDRFDDPRGKTIQVNVSE